MLPITTIYVIVFAYLFILLSINISNLRAAHQVPLGDGGLETLKRGISAHANFAQYVPFLLLILALCELTKVDAALCYVLGFLMLFGRGCHAYSILVYEAKPEAGKDSLRFRKVGMVATYAVFAIAPVFLLLANY